MSGLIDGIFGSRNNDASRLAAENAAASQRSALASLARSQAQTDQAAASSTGGGTKGRRLLTALGAPGLDTLG